MRLLEAILHDQQTKMPGVMVLQYTEVFVAQAVLMLVGVTRSQKGARVCFLTSCKGAKAAPAYRLAIVAETVHHVCRGL